MLVFGFLSVSFFLTYSACFAQSFLVFFIETVNRLYFDLFLCDPLRFE